MSQPKDLFWVDGKQRSLSYNKLVTSAFPFVLILYINLTYRFNK
ncbi:MAG: hypothetical protein RMY27_13115 [Nostoc sp. DedQUE09]|nr:hypothetical protein [Nostoc sp. DedQUE09]